MPRASKRQTRLTFDPLPPSSPAPAGLSQSVRDRAATVRYDGASPAKKRKVRDAPGTSTLTSELLVNGLPPTPDPTAPTNSFGASAVSESDDVRPTPRLSTRKKQQKQQKLDLTPSSPHSMAINSSRPLRAGFFGTQPPAADSSDSDQSLPELPSKGTRQKKEDKKSKHRRAQKSPSPEETPEEMPPTVIPDEESEEEQMPTTPAAARKRKRQASSPSSPFLVPDEDEDDDSDVVITGSRKRSLSTKKRAPPPEPESELDQEDPPSSTTRKRLRRGKATPMITITEEEKQELQDDLMDLASSGSDTEVRVHNRKKSSQKSARELALERLKRRRGAPGNQEVAEDEEEQSDGAEEEYEEAPENEDEDEDDENDELPEPSTHRTTRKQMFAEDEEDEGFVIDDDEGPLGAPTGVPIAFTRYASMKAKDLFKFAIDWMVQKKINPTFQVDDEIYTLTFKKLDDEVKGLAGSKFQSAAWTSKFTLALQARPDLLFVRINRQSSEHFMRDKCDACNRSGHPATYEVRFEGKPYHKETLEPVAPQREHDSSDSDDSSDESSINSNAAVNHDSQGRAILPEETTFYLGKFCMSNAETAHSLQHWRYHLYEWVVEYLESAGWNKPELIVKRDGWSTRKRRKHANKIVDIMEGEGKIKALYQDFKREIDTARNAKQGRWDSSP